MVLDLLLKPKWHLFLQFSLIFQLLRYFRFFIQTKVGNKTVKLDDSERLGSEQPGNSKTILHRLNKRLLSPSLTVQCTIESSNLVITNILPQSI